MYTVTLAEDGLGRLTLANPYTGPRSMTATIVAITGFANATATAHVLDTIDETTLAD